MNLTGCRTPHFEETSFNMGSRVGRLFRNFNLENRVHRELSKDKPKVAPRHQLSAPPEPSSGGPAAEIVSQKNEPLLGHLRSVYVQSVEPLPPPSDANAQAVEEEAERRPLRFTFPSPIYGLEDFSDVPKGKLSLAEALKALGSHQHRPKHWTPEKISQEFSLDLKDTKALVEFFIPFKVEIIPPKTRADKQIKASSD